MNKLKFEITWEDVQHIAKQRNGQNLSRKPARGGKNGGWISATYKNVLAIDPAEMKFFDEKDDAVEYAENTWPSYPWDKYRHSGDASWEVFYEIQK